MSVCGVIVTYQPSVAELAANLAKLRPQVDLVVVIDNASREAILVDIREIAATLQCSLIENEKNLGIAQALNQGVRFASDRGASFVLFFDQDSAVAEGFVSNEMACYESSLKVRKIGLVTPTVIKRSDGSRHGPVRLRNGEIVLAQTSGALMPLEVFHSVGLFRSDMFIDYVDYEHCFRMALDGWQIAYAELAELDHMPGNGTPAQVFGKTVMTVNASPIRHYYETRNCLWVFRSYFRSFPEMTVRLLLRLIYVRLHAIAFEDHRLAKFHAIVRGALDGLRPDTGRQGR